MFCDLSKKENTEKKPQSKNRSAPLYLGWEDSNWNYPFL